MRKAMCTAREVPKGGTNGNGPMHKGAFNQIDTRNIVCKLWEQITSTHLDKITTISRQHESFSGKVRILTTINVFFLKPLHNPSFVL